jgi:hypothetical protein
MHFVVLQQQFSKPMIEWGTQEVYDFIKKLEFEENTAKIAMYKNINGKMLLETENLY